MTQTTESRIICFLSKQRNWNNLVLNKVKTTQEQDLPLQRGNTRGPGIRVACAPYSTVTPWPLYLSTLQLCRVDLLDHVLSHVIFKVSNFLLGFPKLIRTTLFISCFVNSFYPPLRRPLPEHSISSMVLNMADGVVLPVLTSSSCIKEFLEWLKGLTGSWVWSFTLVIRGKR